MLTNFEMVSNLNDAFGKFAGDSRNFLGQLDLIREEMDETVEANEEADLVATLDGLGDLLVVTYGAFHMLGFDANVIMMIIDHCNRTKFCPTLDDVEETLKQYRIQGLKNLGVGTSTNGQRYVYITEDDHDSEGKLYPQGKFLKNHAWESPEPYIQKYLNMLDSEQEFTMADVLSL